MDYDLKEEIRAKRKEGWIEAWFAIEALAVNEETVKTAMESHIERLCNAKDVFVYEKKFLDIRKVEKPLKNVDSAFSQVVEVKLFVKSLFSLINIVMLFGPSSIEIIGPNRKEINIDEVQNIANMIAGIIHEFAAAGIGGMVINPK